MSHQIWEQCLAHLENELTAQEFSTWIRPLQVNFVGQDIHLLAPNSFVRDWVSEHFLNNIKSILKIVANPVPAVSVEIGSQEIADSLPEIKA